MSDDMLDSIFENAVDGKALIKNRRTLTIDYVPEKLPFRDEETKTVAQTLSVVLKGARPSNLLLFGKPGTGKTAVVKNVVQRLHKKAKDLGIEVTVPFVNAKTANTGYKVLYEIAESMGINNEEEKKLQVHFTGLSMGEATDRILDFIQKKKKLHVVLIIDEVDSLVERNGDDILYNFTRANERISQGGFISLIGVSNSLTFKDKLDPRVRSSLSEEEMVFNPYTVEQLRKILTDRVKLAFNDDVISSAAINLCAAMAGKENGDARKAIDLLRVAAEIAERERSTNVGEKHIRLAQEKIEKDTNYEVLKNSTTHTKIVILAILKSKNGNTGEVYEIYSSLCNNAEHEPLTQRRITQIISELDQLGLVTSDVVSKGRYGRSQKIKITVPTLTVRDAFKDDPSLPAWDLVD
ncbi:MAG TPA: orc1/cdc6 family replication initiation protein [Candidatus Bathyarchaeia archaeon]|nr:orc1/cdc6 family replication initiation protein [Candidatus Bathyarchaeia archaeon]